MHSGCKHLRSCGVRIRDAPAPAPHNRSLQTSRRRPLATEPCFSPCAGPTQTAPANTPAPVPCGRTLFQPMHRILAAGPSAKTFTQAMHAQTAPSESPLITSPHNRPLQIQGCECGQTAPHIPDSALRATKRTARACGYADVLPSRFRRADTRTYPIIISGTAPNPIQSNSTTAASRKP